jgi:hypothetical protein
MRVVTSAILLVAGCSGGAASMMMPAAPTGGLDNGATLTASLEIPAGMTATIPPGARIVAAPGVTITVSGVLVVASAEKHARIATASPPSDPSGDWGGIVVASGGQLQADGLDLADASQALWLESGSMPSRYDDGTISDAQHPFQIDTGARLDTAHAAVANAASASAISGEFNASYLDYETTGLAGGLIMSDASAIFDATDSTFHGATVGGGDYITTYAAALVHVAYSTVNDAHCAFHFNDVTRFEIDHVSAGLRAGAQPGMGGPWVVYGAMLYGSEAGPNVISNSNFAGTEYGFEWQAGNGPITITNTYTMGLNSMNATWTWAPADVATAPIQDAHPR